MTRTTWDETWMAVAETMAQRSLCTNRQVGCVIVTSSNRPMAVGYNGPPANFNRTTHEGLLSFAKSEGCNNWCDRAKSQDRGTTYSNCVSVHAEANALLFADRRDYAGGTMYVTNPCCWDCAKLVANSGISRLVVRLSERDAHYDNESSLSFIRSCGILVDIFPPKERGEIGYWEEEDA
jgi:dCMP deaminase